MLIKLLIIISQLSLSYIDYRFSASRISEASVLHKLNNRKLKTKPKL